METIMIDADERDALRGFARCWGEHGTLSELGLMVDGTYAPDEQILQNALDTITVLDAIGWDLEGEDRDYEIPVTPAFRRRLWEAYTCETDKGPLEEPDPGIIALGQRVLGDVTEVPDRLPPEAA